MSASRPHPIQASDNLDGLGAFIIMNEQLRTGWYRMNRPPLPNPSRRTVLRAAMAGAALNPTGSWDTWASTSVSVPLWAGSNKIRATATTSNGGPNVDKLTVS